MVKKLNAVHKCFTTLNGNGTSNDKKVCKYCNWTTVNNATRMINHIVKCVKCPKQVKAAMEACGNITSKSKVSDKDKPKYTFGTMPTVSHLDPSGSGTNGRSLITSLACDTITANTTMAIQVGIPTSPCDSADFDSVSTMLETPKSSGSTSTIWSQQSSYSGSGTRLDAFFDRMSPQEQVDCDILLARAIYASAAPLSMVENPYWQTLFKKLRPIYKLPNKHQVSNSLLENEFGRVQKSANDLILSSDCLGLMCDGWTNLRNESIVNFVITTPQPVFYQSLQTHDTRHTSEYMAECLLKVIEEIGPGKFYGLVTDNAANMKKAWAIVSLKYSHISAYGCIAHGLSLLINDCVKMQSLVDLVNEGKRIVKDINNGHILKAVFVEKQNQSSGPKISLKLPVVTRWGSVVAFLDSLLKNKAAIRSLNIDERCEKDLSPSSKRSIISEIFWDKVYHLKALLQPISQWITKIEGDVPQISLVCRIFSELSVAVSQNVSQAPCLKSEEVKVMEILESRKKFCLRSVHKAANMLDPKLRGVHLTLEDEVDAAEYIHKLAKSSPDIDEQVAMGEFALYKLKQGIFAKEYMWSACDGVPGHVWWTVFCARTQLAKIATKILALPASSAACERTFSTYKDVHSYKRNRLTTDRAGKLTYIKHNLKLQQTDHEATTKQTETDALSNTVPVRIPVFNLDLDDDELELEEQEVDNDLIEEDNIINSDVESGGESSLTLGESEGEAEENQSEHSDSE